MASCSLEGRCEDNYTGPYHSIADCERSCQGVPDKAAYEIALMVVDEDPILALELAPQ